MKQLLLFITISFALSSCTSDPGQDNATIKTTMMFIVIAVIGAIVYTTNDTKKVKEQTQASNKAFFDEAIKAIKETGIISSNVIISPPNFGLAIDNDLEKIAVYTSTKQLLIYQKDKLISSECRYTYNEYVNSKTKVPVISMMPQANTNGQIIKKLAFAEVAVSLNDLTAPLLKFEFFKQEEAERYDALIKLVINNKGKQQIV